MKKMVYACIGILLRRTVCASKEEAVVIYLDVIRRFIDFHEKDCRELAGRSYLRALE